MAQDLVQRVGQLGDVDPAVRQAALDSLRDAGDAADAALLEGLDTCGPLARWEAVKLLGEKRKPELAPVFVSILESGDFRFVRRAAAVALGKTGAPEGLEPLKRYFEEDPVAGAEGLGLLGDRSAVPDLLFAVVEGAEKLQDFRRFGRLLDRDAFPKEEGRRVGDLAVIGTALLRLGSRGGVPVLLDAVKFTEWVGLYARAAFCRYLGDDMPPVMPPVSIGDPAKRTLATLTALAKFWDLEIDVYVSPHDLEPLSPSEESAFRSLIDELAGNADRERKAAIIEVLALEGKPVVPLLLEAIERDSSITEVADALYEVSRPLRFSREPRLTAGVWRDLKRAIPEVSPEARAVLLDVVADLIHPNLFEGGNLQPQLYPEETFAKILEQKNEATALVASFLASEDRRDRLAALSAMSRIGQEDFIDPVVALLGKTENTGERIAAIRVLERIRGPIGAPSSRNALRALDLDGEGYPVAVRVQAARSLGFVGDLRGIPVLLDALESDDAEVRAVAGDSLRTIADRFYGFDAAADEEERRPAVERWRSWWEEGKEAFQVTITRIREQEFRYDIVRRKRREMEAGWWAIADAKTMKDRTEAERLYYIHRREFLPFLIAHFVEAPHDSRPIFANLIASCFDKRMMAPFFVRTLVQDGDSRVQVVAMDALGMLTQVGIDEREAETIAGIVRPLLQDESEEPIVRIQAARTLGHLGYADGVGYLIACLGLESDAIAEPAWHREEAFTALREITVKAGDPRTFGYEPNAPQTRRAEAVAKWETWWKEAEPSFSLPIDTPAGESERPRR